MGFTSQRSIVKHFLLCSKPLYGEALGPRGLPDGIVVGVAAHALVPGKEGFEVQGTRKGVVVIYFGAS